MTIADAAAAFVTLHLEAERNLSPHTLRNYGGDLRRLADFLGGETPVEAIDHVRIRDFLAHLYDGGAGKATVARHLATVRSLMKYLARHGAIPENPARLVGSPRLRHPLPEIPSTEQLNRLLDQAPGEAGTSFPERDHAMLELLYGSGLRVSELTGLDLGAVDFAEGTVRVLGKGRQERLVPLGGKSACALRAYLERRAELPRTDAANGKALFLNLRGYRITPRSVARIVKTCARRLGLPLDLHPHALRHAFASHLLDEGADLRAIQEMLGHRSLATTQRYTRTDIRRLSEVYDRSHPKA